VDRTVARVGGGEGAVIPILQDLQARFGYLPDEVLQRVCETTAVTPAEIMGITTFFNRFRREPVGSHMISVCHGTACHVKGAERVSEALRRYLGLEQGKETDAKRLFTLEKVACLGCCTLAPAVKIDEVTYGHMTAERVPRMVRDFLAMKKERQRIGEGKELQRATEGKGEIRIGLGSCCVSRGSGRLFQALEQTLARARIDALIKQVGCVGMCHQTPLLEVIPPGSVSHLYARVEPEDAEAIVLRHFKPGSLFSRLKVVVSRAFDSFMTGELRDPVAGCAIHVKDEPVAAFLARQERVATAGCGETDPMDIEEYMRRDGFSALRRCVGESDPEGVIDRIRASGLRGRGGAGYSTGLKWSQVRQAEGSERWVILNGDEGDPGAFMDRMILESHPFRVIEGMIIAAFAVGAGRGFLYIREEYPLAVRRMREALDLCRERGVLGREIFGSSFAFDMRVMEGAGAFVCGEETALISSIEGKRGTPRPRPPYPSQSGLWGMPTLVNNVETFALVPAILNKDAAAFSALGTGTSPGTKVFALAGKVARCGLIEVPMGITIREIVEGIGGGIAGGRRLKAVQVGGPSGGCIPAELADLPVEYESLTTAGAIMGSGGLVVLDEDDCMVDIARYFLEFTQKESCGKCVFCRVGTKRMLEILERLCSGRGRKGDLDALEEVATAVKNASLCGLGATAPNPVLSTLRHFRGEYEAHLEGRCPAAKCRALITFSVTDRCIGCTLCAQRCPVGAIAMTPYERHRIDAVNCVRCGTCSDLCPASAIDKE